MAGNSAIFLLLLATTFVANASVLKCGDASTRDDAQKCTSFNGGGLCTYDATSEPKCRVDQSASGLGVYMRKAKGQLWVPEKPKGTGPVTNAAKKYAQDKGNQEMKDKVEGNERFLSMGGDFNVFDVFDFPQCLVDVPMCHRTACGGDASQQNATQCLTDPKCCFDKDLFYYRHTFGADFMGEALTCYYGPTSTTYQEIAATIVPWNAWYSSTVLDLFQSALNSPLKDAQGKQACHFTENFDAVQNICGWENITEIECKLKSCCYTNKGLCIYPSGDAMNYFQVKETYPELYTYDPEETQCRADPFANPKIFNRLSCQKVDTSDPYSILKCHKDCCLDRNAFQPTLKSWGLLNIIPQPQIPSKNPFPPTRRPRPSFPSQNFPNYPPSNGGYGGNPNPYQNMPPPMFPGTGPSNFPFPSSNSNYDNSNFPPEVKQMLAAIQQASPGFQGPSPKLPGMPGLGGGNDLPPGLHAMLKGLGSSNTPSFYGQSQGGPPNNFYNFGGNSGLSPRSGSFSPRKKSSNDGAFDMSKLFEMMYGMGGMQGGIGGMPGGMGGIPGGMNYMGGMQGGIGGMPGSNYMDPKLFKMLTSSGENKMDLASLMKMGLIPGMGNPVGGGPSSAMSPLILNLLKSKNGAPDISTLLQMGLIPGMGSSSGGPQSMNPMALFSLMNKNGGGKLDIGTLMQMGMLPGLGNSQTPGGMGKFAQILALSKMLKNGTSSPGSNNDMIMMYLLSKQLQQRKQQQAGSQQQGSTNYQQGTGQNYYGGQSYNAQQNSNNQYQQQQNQPNYYQQQQRQQNNYYQSNPSPNAHNPNYYQHIPTTTTTTFPQTTPTPAYYPGQPGMGYDLPQLKSAEESGQMTDMMFLRSILSGQDDGPLNLESLYCPYSFDKIGNFPDLSHSVRGCCKVTACYHKKQLKIKKPVLPSPTYSSWSEWTPCHKTCGAGEQSYRTRRCITAGTCHGSSFEHVECPYIPCPEDGIQAHLPTLPPFVPTSEPTIPSRQSQEEFMKQMMTSMNNNNNNQQPSFPSQYGEWSTWTVCDRTCGVGVISRTRTCNNVGMHPPNNKCFGSARETKVCAVEACPTATFQFTTTKPTEPTEDPFAWMKKMLQDENSGGFQGGKPDFHGPPIPAGIPTAAPHTYPEITTKEAHGQGSYGYSKWSEWSKCVEEEGPECTGRGTQERSRECFQTFDGRTYVLVKPQSLCPAQKTYSTQTCMTVCYPDMPGFHKGAPVTSPSVTTEETSTLPPFGEHLSTLPAFTSKHQETLPPFTGGHQAPFVGNLNPAFPPLPNPAFFPLFNGAPAFPPFTGERHGNVNLDNNNKKENRKKGKKSQKDQNTISHGDEERHGNDVHDGEWGAWGKCDAPGCGRSGKMTRRKICTAKSEMCHQAGDTIYSTKECSYLCPL